MAPALVLTIWDLMEKSHFLRQRRQELGLSQNDLELRLKSRGIKFSRKSISAWERGERDPELDQKALEALAEAVRWDLETLVGALRGSK
jgi:transcriptional regulator with XRE-family HTH domain